MRGLALGRFLFHVDATGATLRNTPRTWRLSYPEGPLLPCSRSLRCSSSEGVGVDAGAGAGGAGGCTESATVDWPWGADAGWVRGPGGQAHPVGQLVGRTK